MNQNYEASHPILPVAMTGATGLIGRQVAALLKRNGISPRVLVRSNPAGDAPDVIPGSLEDEGARNLLVSGAGSLVHIAGVAHTTLRGEEDRSRAWRVNVDSTCQLLHAAKRAGVRRVLLFSSAHVYAGQQGTNLKESAATAPDGDYARMKLEAERCALELAGTDFSVAILRPCLVYGPGVRFNLDALMRAVTRGRYVHPAGADAQRSMVSVETVAAAVWHLLNSLEHTGPYNLADRDAVSLREWVNQLADLLGAPHPRAVSASLLRVAAAAGTIAARVGLPAPLTRDSLRKLTTSFTLNTDRLASAGFQWPGTEKRVLQEMTNAFRANLGETK